MAAPRLFGTSRGPLRFIVSSSSSSSSGSLRVVKCSRNDGIVGDVKLAVDGERKSIEVPSASVSEGVITSEMTTTSPGNDLSSLLPIVHDALLKVQGPPARRKSLKSQVEMLLGKAILDCRFFTLFAVAGSLVGSVLCFLGGSCTIIETYFQYFYTLSHKSGQGRVVQLAIQAIDEFLIGVALLAFGASLYAMFVGSKSARGKEPSLSGSNLFGLFYLKTPPTWVELQSVSQAKLRIGHAVMTILQVGLLEKFRSIPLVTGLDLACSAGAVLLSSVSVFLLSRLSTGHVMEDR
ncbi:Uncharacterized protein family UPF0114 [Dillenia turbinata]|uniref:Uncharacterized protein family UPF0114 n=1 Tax=Dillenia turbinata TaxID=194707 RepID=A0AAN8VZQ0_9MAGN